MTEMSWVSAIGAMARTLVRVALKFAGAIVIVWLAAQVGFWFFLYNFTLFEPPIAVALVPSAIVGCAAAVFLFRTFPIWRFRARATAAPAAHTLGTAAQGSRRRLRFSLRTLLLIVGLCAVLASWFPITAAHDRTESAALSRINEAGGKEKGWKDFAHLRRVTALSFSPFWGPTGVFKDNTLQDLLPHLRQLRHLDSLDLTDTFVTDASASALVRELPYTKSLSLKAPFPLSPPDTRPQTPDTKTPSESLT